jgi:molecular chaperone HscB
LISINFKRLKKNTQHAHSSLINKAYRVLDSPIQRAIYILKINGFNYEKEAIDTQSDVCKKKILFEVMELNELLDEIETPAQVENLEKILEETMRPFQKELEEAINVKDFKESINVIAKMKYYKNIDDRLQDLKLKFNLNNNKF